MVKTPSFPTSSAVSVRKKGKVSRASRQAHNKQLLSLKKQHDQLLNEFFGGSKSNKKRKMKAKSGGEFDKKAGRFGGLPYKKKQTAMVKHQVNAGGGFRYEYLVCFAIVVLLFLSISALA